MFAEPAWHIASQVWLNKNPLRNTAVVSNHCCTAVGRGGPAAGSTPPDSKPKCGGKPLPCPSAPGARQARGRAPVVPAMLLIKLAGGKDGKKYDRVVVPVWEPANSSSSKIMQKLYLCFLLMTAWRGCWCDSEEQVGCAFESSYKMRSVFCSCSLMSLFLRHLVA